MMKKTKKTSPPVSEWSLEKLDSEIEILGKMVHEINNGPMPPTFDEFLDRLAPYNDKITLYEGYRKLLTVPEFDKKIPDYGDVMSLESFKDCVRSGGFMDYDGYGYYVKDGKMSTITIIPSDVHNKLVRKDFDTIVWFNR